MTKKPSVFVYGYKKLNLGDDLFFTFLLSRYPHVKFVFCGKKEYKHVLKAFKNVKVVTPYSPYDLFCTVRDKFGKQKEPYMVRTADYKVLITGSGFVEKGHDIFDGLPVADERLCVMGSNFGPFLSDDFVAKGRRYFAACRDVCFRDTYSQELFVDLPNVRRAPDIVFGSARHRDEMRRVAVPITGAYAVISVLSFDKRRTKDKTVGERYRAGIGQVARFLISRGLRVVFMSFCDMENDMDTVRQLMSDPELSQYAEAYAYDGNMKEAVALIAHADAMVATRFHAMVLGFSMGVKTLPIVYNPKMRNVLEDLQYDGLSYTETTVAEATEEELTAWYESDRIVSVDCADEAGKHFAVLDEVLQHPCPERWVL